MNFQNRANLGLDDILTDPEQGEYADHSHLLLCLAHNLAIHAVMHHDPGDLRDLSRPRTRSEC